MTPAPVVPGIEGWDDIKLREVWSEFIWHVRRAGYTRVDDLSEHNLRVYFELRKELKRRGTQLTLFH